MKVIAAKLKINIGAGTGLRGPVRRGGFAVDTNGLPYFEPEIL